MGAVIRQAAPEDIELLMEWRMEVLREVFSIPKDHKTEELEKENRRYYRWALESGRHLALSLIHI